MVVAILFVLESGNHRVEPPDRDFGDAIANALKLRRILRRNCESRWTGQTDQFLHGGFDDSRTEVLPVNDVLADLRSVRVLTCFYGPALDSRLIGCWHHR